MSVSSASLKTVRALPFVSARVSSIYATTCAHWRRKQFKMEFEEKKQAAKRNIVLTVMFPFNNP